MARPSLSRILRSIITSATTKAEQRVLTGNLATPTLHALCQTFQVALYRRSWRLTVFRAQYTNLVGVLGRNGEYGLQTLYVEDVKRFYLLEYLPLAYERRELPYYSVESTVLNDRMTHHIGFQF